MRILTLLLLAAGIAVVAGCATPDGGTPDAGDDGTNMTGNDNGTTTSVSMDFPAAGPGPLAPAGGSFEVPANATMVIVEARWDCTSPTCEIAISLTDPDGAEAGAGTGAGSVDIQIANPAPGSYGMSFSTTAPIAGVSGEARVTVFTRGVPDGFTAWEEDAA